jgi:hypothetical protein
MAYEGDCYRTRAAECARLAEAANTEDAKPRMTNQCEIIVR